MFVPKAAALEFTLYLPTFQFRLILKCITILRYMSHPLSKKIIARGRPCEIFTFLLFFPLVKLKPLTFVYREHSSKACKNFMGMKETCVRKCFSRYVVDLRVFHVRDVTRCRLVTALTHQLFFTPFDLEHFPFSCKKKKERMWLLKIKQWPTNKCKIAHNRCVAEKSENTYTSKSPRSSMIPLKITQPSVTRK